jgi:POT family proton-dependent oligopeptide transporter
MHAAAPTTGDWFGHPRGLSFLFLTGMWEVVSVFGMRTILVFYLVKQLHFSAPDAIKVFGFSSAASFLMSLLGGVVADRLVGARRAVVIGAPAHFLLIIPAMLFPCLGIVAIGTGLFRPSLVAQVWTLYRHDDPRRSRALLLYKLGCNIGGIFGPIVCGALYETIGWGAAVAFCGSGMLVATLTFLASGRFVGPAPAHRTPLERAPISPAVLGSVGQRIWLLLVVGIGASLHWTVANQQGGAISLWAFQSLDRTVRLGASSFVIPAAWFQSLNPILILAFTPILAAIWKQRERRLSLGIETLRMTLGSVLLASAFLLLSGSAALAGAKAVNWIWLALAFMPITLGELYIDPMGQAVFSRLAPPKMLSTFLSLWFFTFTIGYLGANWLGDLWVPLPKSEFFMVSAAIALLSALVLLGARSLVWAGGTDSQLAGAPLPSPTIPPNA